MPVGETAFLALASLICVGAFLSGLRFARMTKNPWVGRSILGQPVSGHDFPIERIRLFGKIQMIAAPIFLLFFIALASGLLEPVDLG